MTDSNDVALAEAGDYEAFQRLYQRYYGSIYSLCVRLCASRDRGKALTEEVFVNAWQQLPYFDEQTSFEAWLRRLAAEFVLSSEAAGGASVPEADSNYSPIQGDGGEAAREPGNRLALAEALAVLQPSARGIFVLHDVEGFQHHDIAEILGITVGASKARLQQARVLLMKAMGR